MLIKINDKQYMLEFTYKSIYFLEVAFEKPYIETLGEQTPYNQQLMTFWSMMINEEEFKNHDIMQMAEVVQESLERGDFDINEFFDKVNKAYLDSTIVKQIFDLPSDSGRRGRASENKDRRGLFHGIMSRLANRFRGFLEKYPEDI